MKYLSDVTTLEYDRSKCTGCGLCTRVCPHGVFRMEAGKAVITDRDLCMECGACMRNCAFSAIKVVPGVGCAAAIISSRLKGSKSIDCGCSGACGSE
ncbi:MAG: 4Fe-4S binding protein [Spirochaetales bacterium]|nr:4Fe-4S binding protein [Spirochaetales bacterium]